MKNHLLIAALLLSWFPISIPTAALVAVPDGIAATELASPELFAAADPLGQGDGSASPKPKAKRSEAFSSVGIGVQIGTLGPGVEVATPLSHRTNLRGAFNFFKYSDTFTTDGITYAGTLQMQSAEVLMDWFPFAGRFHLSPGALLYNGNQITANASVPARQTFTLSGTTYSSNPANPVNGNASLVFNKAAPMVLVGFGNLAKRRGHISISTEVGVAFTGQAKINLSLIGSACDASGANCRNVATDPTIQNNVQSQQTKFKNDLSVVQFYPILSLGIGYKF